MDKKAFQEDLRSLAQGKKERRSNTALVADVMDDIEAALAKGVLRVAIHQALLKQGVTLTFQGFETALRELRKKRRANTAPATQAKQATQTALNQPRVETNPQVPTNKPATLKPNIPGYVSKVTDKDREEYQAFKESIKDLPDRERRKKLEEWREQRQQF